MLVKELALNFDKQFFCVCPGFMAAVGGMVALFILTFILTGYLSLLKGGKISVSRIDFVCEIFDTSSKNKLVIYFKNLDIG